MRDIGLPTCVYVGEKAFRNLAGMGRVASQRVTSISADSVPLTLGSTIILSLPYYAFHAFPLSVLRALRVLRGEKID